MITVIIDGTKNIDNTLRSLESNATADFRVFVEESVRDDINFWEYNKIEIVEPGLLRKYGPRSDIYWLVPSGGLVLTSAWDERLVRAGNGKSGTYCLIPANANRCLATNKQGNVGKWKGEQVIVPILGITEV